MNKPMLMILLFSSLSLVRCPLSLAKDQGPGTKDQGQRTDEIKLDVHLNQSAIWVGDRLEYAMTVEYPPDIKFVLDNVKKEGLSLPPFEVLDLQRLSRQLANGRGWLELKLVLRSFETGSEELTIPSFNLYYFRGAAATTPEETQAETIAVPPAKVGLRSTLTSQSETIRDFKEVEPMPTERWLLPGLIGSLGFLLIGGYAAFRAARKLRLVGSWQKERTDRRARRKSWLEALQQMKERDLDSMLKEERFYGQASQLLRGLAAERLGDVAGLTPHEVERALVKIGADGHRASVIRQLLEQCDTMRYAPNGYGHEPLRRDEFLQRVEEITKEMMNDER